VASKRTGRARGRSDVDEALYVISVAAELAGVHPQTLRMYERRGLLRPARTSGRVRRYSMRDIEHVRLIQELTQDQGMNLAGAEMVMQLQRQLEEAQERFEMLRLQMEEMRDRMLDEMEQVRKSFRAELVPVRNQIMLYEGAKKKWTSNDSR
jgi:MerR family transcriptional regulator, heat shock protein HspR